MPARTSEPERARCGFAITEDTTCALKPGHAGYHSPNPDPAESAWKYTPPFVPRPDLDAC